VFGSTPFDIFSGSLSDANRGLAPRILAIHAAYGFLCNKHVDIADESH
jgi:hypothetical protein